jgi:hypothetical protein
MTTEVSGASDPNVNLADSRWHTVSILKKKRQISLEIDGRYTNVTKGAPEKPNFKVKGGLVIGGVPKSLTRRANQTFTKFVGCIRDFRINSEEQKLMGVKTQRGTLPCYEPQPPGMYFPGGGFVRFSKQYFGV